MGDNQILIVDDDQNVHEILTLYLEKENFTVSSAYDGEEALTKIETKDPDLIILDIMMPKLELREILSSEQLEAAAEYGRFGFGMMGVSFKHQQGKFDSEKREDFRGRSAGRKGRHH